MAETIVDIQNVSHRYAKNWAVRNVSLQIDRVGIMGLLGSNGAGKSTLMNIICGVLAPTEGCISIGGVGLKENPLEAKQKIGFLPQQAPLYSDLTVDEYLNHCATLRNVPSKRVHICVDEAKARCGISDRGQQLIAGLSGGYRQRVGLAQSILHQPELVVLDEPTNGLDPNQILSVRKLIRSIAEERAVLISTHMLSEVEAVCDDIRMIENGEVVFSGSIDEFSDVVQPNSVVVNFSNPPDWETLCRVPGVSQVEGISNRKFRLRVRGGSDDAEKIVVASVENGWGLQEISFERSSLEDVFAHLSRFDGN